MEDKRGILKSLISKADLRVRILEAEKQSIQADLDECITALDGYKDQLERLDKMVFIQVPANGECMITRNASNCWRNSS